MDQILSPFTARPTKTATEQIFETLYKAVIALDLPPGTKVSEAEVAKQLDVSRQPVRDAFYRLSKLGFLSIRPQRATFVTKISETAVINAVFIRTALEVECLRTAARTAREDLLSRLEDNLSRQQKAITSEDPTEFHVLDEEFHQIICECAGHGHVWELIKEQKAHMDRVRFLTLSQERRQLVLEQHTEIVEAIAAGDTAVAEESFRTHLGGIGNILDLVRNENTAFFE